jgi:hypothetical protein
MKENEVDTLIENMLDNDEPVAECIPEPTELGDIATAELNVQGCRNTVAHILVQAILDYKMLEEKGIVKAGKMIRPLKSKNEVDDYSTEHQVKRLLNWFNQKEEMQYWLDLAHIHIHSDHVLKGLGIPV